eukprot:TRINITY_DN16155_c0_g1_i1.p1 TRINITY_DN16155_c0_g1~~TRINITY_DN16155_c0_g1_i1.p1  ORF type:complete len:448 (+),score=69.03 TRINITY_DN16155_c0_g1_i1:322-1665(+)
MAKRWSSRDEIPFEVVAETFVLPIVEASAKLGLSIATLKRACKEHGIPRWPYRKVMAGRSIEEIKREADLMVAKEFEDGTIEGLRSAGSQKSPVLDLRSPGIPRGDGGTPGVASASHPSTTPGVPKKIIVKLNGKGVIMPPGALHFSQQQASPGTTPGPLPLQAFPTFSPYPLHPPDYPYPYPLPLSNSRRVPLEQRKALALTSHLQAFHSGFPSKDEGGLPREDNRWWGSEAPESKNEYSEDRERGRREGTGAYMKDGEQRSGEGPAKGFRSGQHGDANGEVREDKDASAEEKREEGGKEGTEKSRPFERTANPRLSKVEDMDGKPLVLNSAVGGKASEIQCSAPTSGEEPAATQALLLEPEPTSGGVRATRVSPVVEKQNAKEKALLPSVLLHAKRKRISEMGRQGVTSSYALGYGAGQASEKDAQTLRFVFGNFLPSAWQTGVY